MTVSPHRHGQYSCGAFHPVNSPTKPSDALLNGLHIGIRNGDPYVLVLRFPGKIVGTHGYNNTVLKE